MDEATDDMYFDTYIPVVHAEHAADLNGAMNRYPDAKYRMFELPNPEPQNQLSSCSLGLGGVSPLNSKGLSPKPQTP